jgi:hypothetical protein
MPVFLTRNVASSANGATATSNGVDLDKLIDDTEVTNWAFVGSDPAVQEEAIGEQVTVQLDPSLPGHEIRRVQVSAMLRPRLPNPFPQPPPPARPPNPDPVQNRFSALRQFEILVCQATASVDCTQDDQFTSIFISPADAFPSVAPRPRAPELIARSFAVPRSVATHVRIRVLQNQCTGGPDFQGEQDNDPQFVTDCGDGSAQDDIVRIAELQVFRR